MSSPDNQFDWGPPVSKWQNTLKEWIVYIILLCLLGVSGYALLDFGNGRKLSLHRRVVPDPVNGGNLIATPETPGLDSDTEPGQPLSGSTFQVQMGAFGDEADAKATFVRLQDAGFVARLAEPDEQYDMYRVLVGPFQTEVEAESISRKLNSLDFPCFVIESP